MDGLRIGELAAAARVPIQTVRYYERRNLIPDPPRDTNGYRVYPPDIVTRIRFIRGAKSLGFSLSEISSLLDLRVATGDDCGAVRERAEETLSRIDGQLSMLSEMRTALTEVIGACERNEPTNGCPLIERAQREYPS